MKLLQRPKGTRDILPAECRSWQNLEKFLRDTANLYGFREIRVPTFEKTELFSRGVGETTDVVQKEMYTVTAGNSSFTLRPEGTAGTIRAILENGMLNDALPQRVYYILSCFRHENKQKDRYREFHQFGVEMIGSPMPSADAEIIAMANQILSQLGLINVSLHINSIGCPTCRKAYQEALRAYFAPVRECLCATCQERYEKNPLRLLDCKESSCKKLGLDAPIILDYLCDECKTHFATLKSHLDALGIAYEIDPKIVRGLDYYTKTVFEFVTQEENPDDSITICGGGRYDGLIAELGGHPTPALGFGLGLERLLTSLSKAGISMSDDFGCDLYLIPLGDDATQKALQLTASLRREGISAQTDVMGRGLRAQMKHANKVVARFTLVLGDDELKTGKATLKNMKSGEEIPLTLGDGFIKTFSDIEIADRLAL